MNIYRFLNVLTALFSVQILYTYLSPFRERFICHKTGVRIMWGLYFFLQYLSMDSPSRIDPLLLLSANILLIALIQFISGSSVETTLLRTCILITFWMVAEAVTQGFLLAAGTDEEYLFATGSLISKLALYIIIQAYRRLLRKNIGIALPFRYWVELILVSVSSICIIYSTRLLILHKWTNILFALVSILMILVNYIIFDVYEKISSHALIERQNHAYEQELSLCVRQAAEREEAYRQTSTLRHDLKGRLIALRAFLEEGRIQDAEEEIKKMLGENSLNRHGVSETGNTPLDALVNYKYDTALAEGASMVCRLDVPADLFVTGPDLCVILGNLLDNALEAVRRLTDEKDRWVSLTVRLVKGVLVITVENPYDGGIAADSRGRLHSGKAGEHGIGLLSVERTVQKYAGEVSIRHDNGIFTVSAMLCQQEFLH